MLASTRPQVIHQGALAHILRYDIDMLAVAHQTDKPYEILMLQRGHNGRFGEKFLGSALVFQHFNGHTFVPQNAQHNITEFTFAYAFAQLQIIFGYHPALVREILGIDAELLFAFFW